tara:strand:- start:52 stop:918 length:867 start_codon:yes stop_codon:yes gene_type:complete
VASKTLFPRSGQLNTGSVLNVRDTIARPSLDTLYQVNFSFGNWQTWLGSGIGRRRTQGSSFMEKMAILCTQAEIPGTSFVTQSTIGHHQGIQEEFPSLRNFPPLNLVFYCDADHVILEVFESWMSYINPIMGNQRDRSAFTRFNYPEDYKEILHITKFERDAFTEDSSRFSSSFIQYEFVNVWPSNMTSMRVAYGDSNVLRCNVQFAYDRFFTSNSKTATHLAFPQNKSNPQSKDVVKTIAQTNVEDIGKGFYNVNMEKTNKKHDVFKNFKQRPENAGAGFYNQNTSK